MAYFGCMLFFQELIGTGLGGVVLTTCDRWSKQHLVKSNTAVLQGDWVGPVFSSFKIGVFVILVFCGALTSLTGPHCEVLS